MQEIPPGLVHTDWMRGLLAEAHQISSTMQEHWDADSAKRAKVQEEQKPVKDFTVGELVLITRPFYERGTGVILKCMAKTPA